jgi:hypothetical protein
VRYRGLAKNTARLLTAFCVGESHSAAATIVATRGDVSVVNEKRAEKAPAYRPVGDPFVRLPMKSIFTFASTAALKSGCAELP